MTKFPLPLILPQGVMPVVTQPFGVTENTLEPVGPHGEAHFHYGIDIVCGEPGDTYGTPIVAPVSGASVASCTFPSPVTNVTTILTLNAYGASGNHYQIVLGHISAVFIKKSYKDGEIVALIGNNGLVSPKPTPEQPFAGSHLHLGLLCNGSWVDPLEFFDLSQTYPRAPHDLGNDVPRLQWALDQARQQMPTLPVSTNQ